MRDFTCPNCGQQLVFENSVCLSCSSPLGFSLAEHALLVIDARFPKRRMAPQRARSTAASIGSATTCVWRSAIGWSGCRRVRLPAHAATAVRCCVDPAA
jgi:hypothetical protein